MRIEWQLRPKEDCAFSGKIVPMSDVHQVEHILNVLKGSLDILRVIAYDVHKWGGSPLPIAAPKREKSYVAKSLEKKSKSISV
jgi:hypothetical protein